MIWARVLVISVLFGPLVLSGCNTRRVSPKSHSPAVKTQSVDGPVDQASSHHSQAAVVNMKEKIARGELDLVRDILDRRAGLVLFEARDIKEIDRIGERGQQDLHLFNWALIQLIESKDSRLISGKWLERYKKAVTYFCQSPTIRHCPRSAFFSQDYQSAVVLRILIERKDCGSWQDCAWLMKVAFDFKAKSNKYPDPKLDLLYIQSAQHIAAALRSGDSEERRRHRERLTTLLERQNDNADVLTAVDKLRPYHQLMNAKSPDEQLDLVPFVAFAGRHLKEKTFLADLRSLTLEQDAQNPNSVSNIVKRIQNLGPAKAGLLQKLGVRVPNLQQMNDQDLYSFFLIHQIYMNKLTLQTANDLWKVSPLETVAFAENLSNYIRFRMITEAVMSNVGMGTWLADSKNYRGQDIYEKTIEKSVTFRERWIYFNRRVTDLKTFFRTNINVAGHANARILEIAKSFDSIHRDIKVLAEYPQMLMLTYYMSATNYKWGSFRGRTIDTTDFINWLLLNSPWNWFEYSDNEAPLNRVEIFKALYFALISDIFTDFKISIPLFYAQVLDQFLSTTRVELDTHLKNMDEYYFRSRTGQEFAYTCNALAKNFSPPVTLTLVDLVSTPLRTLLYGKVSLESGEDYRFGQVFFRLLDWGPSSFAGREYNLTQFDEYSEAIRVDQGQQLRIVAIVNNLIRKSLETAEYMAPAERDNVKRLMDRYEDTIRASSRQLYFRIFEMARMASDCAPRVQAMERQRKVDLYKAERVHLQQVYRALELLNVAGAQANLSVDQLKIRFPNSSFWQTPWAKQLANSRPFFQQLQGSLTAGIAIEKLNVPAWVKIQLVSTGFKVVGETFHYNYSNLAVLTRFRELLRSGYTTLDGQTVAALGPETTIHIPETDEELSQTSSLRLARSKDFAYTANESAFLVDTFEVLNKDFLEWTFYELYKNFYRHMTRTLIALYRSGPVQKIQPGTVDCSKHCSQDQITATELTTRILQMYEELSLTTDEAEFFRMMAVSTPYKKSLRWLGNEINPDKRFENDYLVFRDPLTDAPNPYFDYPMRMALRKYQGYNCEYDQDPTGMGMGGPCKSKSRPKNRLSAFEEASLFYTWGLQTEPLLFDQALAVEPLVKDPYAKLVQLEINMLNNAYEAFSKVDVRSLPPFWVDTFATPIPRLRPLSRERGEELRDRIEVFHEKTGHIFENAR